MSGHSRWSTIKRKKGAADAVRGKIFTKLSKEITVAARMGGGDPTGNPRLRLAIQAARASAMPMDNVSRAIKKGTGELDGGQIEELVYEGYGPGGVAFIIEITTDNQNRTIAEVRSIFDKAGGNLGKLGSVAFIFSKLGTIRYDSAKYSEDKVMEAALEAGAQDVKTEADHVVVYTTPADFHAVKEALDKAGLEALEAQLTMLPNNTVRLDEDMAKRTLSLVERLEDNDDVQKVFANFDISDEIMARLSES
ncbi:MAG: YebC/PmpR family DNA-binding transcriptional regulator [Deltaproteobacteria bacterium]|jgi:YebC/PmpR family DNA-binding regulatory protein|nr:YebC/PmpR family DNA-binding transcriptional regulator [Deltaproteobacteria bacterium]